MCMGVEFLSFNVLLHSKYEQKVKTLFFNNKYKFNNPLKVCFSNKKNTFFVENHLPQFWNSFDSKE